MRFLFSFILMLSLVVWPTQRLIPPKSQQRKATHVVIMKHGEETGVCTASAIGRHALLTADHCDMGTDNLRVDYTFNIHVLGRIKDGKDHIIYLVDGPEFEDTMGSLYNPATYDMSREGDGAFFFGDGGGMFPPQLRKGYRMDHIGFDKDEAPKGMIAGDLFLLDIAAINGDSGSAVYSEETGRLIGVITYALFERFVGTYAMHFTQAQIDQAERF